LRKYLIVLPIALAGCMDAGEPLVSDYNGRIVKIQYHTVPLGDNYQGSPIYEKAVETCALDGRSDAVYQGMTRVSEYTGEHIFLCR
jgi:hypothetical protein